MADGTTEEVIHELLSPDLVILDELGFRGGRQLC